MPSTSLLPLLDDVLEAPQPASLTQRLRRGLQRWAWRGRRGAAAAEAQATQPSTGGRGRALRQAHEALGAWMALEPAVQRRMPHLVVLEQTMAERGSRALKTLPLQVLEHALQQLTRLMHPDDDPPPALPEGPPVARAFLPTERVALSPPSPDDRALRVLRMRLIEAIALRSRAVSRAEGAGPAWAQAASHLGDSSGFEASSGAAWSRFEPSALSRAQRGRPLPSAAFSTGFTSAGAGPQRWPASGGTHEAGDGDGRPTLPTRLLGLLPRRQH